VTERPTLAIGLMSGTSLDGVDAALVRLEGPTHATLLEFVTRPYSNEERAEIRGALNGATTAELARLHVRVAEWAAEEVKDASADRMEVGTSWTEKMHIAGAPLETTWRIHTSRPPGFKTL